VAEQLDHWLAVADNGGEWERLRRALALEQGFVLLIVDVPDVGTEARVVELLAEEQMLVVLDARESGEQAPVRELLRRRGDRVVIRSVEASRSDVESLERCLVQLNMRRDQLVEREHVLVIVLRRDAVARMIDVAPDLYSVHRARFRFARLVVPRPAPAWLLSDVEFAAVLDDDDGRPLDERLKSYVLVFSAKPAGEREDLLMQIPAVDRIAARIFARHECVRCLTWPQPQDLAHALDAPALDSAAILRDSLRLAQATGSSQLAYMCATALAWMHLQQRELVEAHAALEEAIRHHVAVSRRFWIRHRLLELQLGAAEGVFELDPRVPVFDDASWFGAVWLSLAEYQWELWPHRAAIGCLQGALGPGLEMLPFYKWRLDASLRLLPPALIKAAVPEHERGKAISWLAAHPIAGSLRWDELWTKQLMIESAIGHAERVTQLVDLGRRWIEAQSGIYEVWRPLVEIHAQTRDASALEQLIRMPLSADTEQRFGPRLGAALHIVADLVDRGLVELSSTERDELRARAAAREGMAPALRLGWWAIELALTSGQEPE
jgi:hypothetical protein